MYASRQLRSKCRQRLGQIARAVIGPNLGNDQSLLDARVMGYFRDEIIRISAAEEKWPKWSRAEVIDFARAVDLFSPSEEIVEWYPMSKGNGRGFRLVCEFGPELTLRQKIIAPVVDLQLTSPEAFYDRKGAGAPSAVLAVINAIHEIGPYILSADIKDCFPSINFDAVYQLGILPPEVVRYALDYRHLHLKRQEAPTDPSQSQSNFRLYSSYREADQMEGPRGLLQGSMASNAILRHLLADTVRRVDPRVKIIVYVDNFFIVGATEEICRAVMRSLICHLAECPAGPLHLKPAEIIHIDDGLDILGYHLLGKANGEVSVQLSDKNLRKLDKHIEMLVLAGRDRNDIFNHVVAPFGKLDDDFRQTIRDMIGHACSGSASND